MAVPKQLLAVTVVLSLTVFTLNLYVVQKTILPKPYVQDRRLYRTNSSSNKLYDFDGESPRNIVVAKTSSTSNRESQEHKLLITEEDKKFDQPKDISDGWEDSYYEDDLQPNNGYGNIDYITSEDQSLLNYALKIQSKEGKINIYRPNNNPVLGGREPDEVKTLQDKFDRIVAGNNSKHNDNIIISELENVHSTTRDFKNYQRPKKLTTANSNVPGRIGLTNIPKSTSANDKKSATISSGFLNAIMKNSLIKDYVKIFKEGYDELFYTIYPISVGVPEIEEAPEGNPQANTSNEEKPYGVKTETGQMKLNESKEMKENAMGNTKKTHFMETKNSVISSYTIPGCNCSRRLPGILEHPGYVTLTRLSTQRVRRSRKVDKISTCSDHATARGPGQKVVSYSYYGNTTDPGLYYRYFSEIPNRAKEIQKYYPGMVMRVYHNVGPKDHQGQEEMCRAYCNIPHLDLCDVSALPSPWLDFGSKQKVGTIWRFLTLLDPLVDVTLIRDLDSYLLKREVAAVDEWLASSIPYHVMRDHPLHNSHILAGLWGSHTELDRAKAYHYAATILSQPYNDLWDYDQRLLRRILWPAIKDKTMSHDSYTCRAQVFQGRYPPRPFPTQRDGLNYTGYGRTKTGATTLLTTCPKSCRPQSHQDWSLC